MNEHEDRRFTDPIRDEIIAIREILVRMEATYNSDREKLMDHHKTLYGIDGKPGLTIKVDRIEELEKSRAFHRGILYTAVAGLGLDRLMFFFKK